MLVKVSTIIRNNILHDIRKVPASCGHFFVCFVCYLKKAISSSRTLAISLRELAFSDRASIVIERSCMEDFVSMELAAFSSEIAERLEIVSAITLLAFSVLSTFETISLVIIVKKIFGYFFIR